MLSTGESSDNSEISHRVKRRIKMFSIYPDLDACLFLIINYSMS